LTAVGRQKPFFESVKRICTNRVRQIRLAKEVRRKMPERKRALLAVLAVFLLAMVAIGVYINSNFEGEQQTEETTTTTETTTNPTTTTTCTG